MVSLSPPRPISSGDDIGNFLCGEPVLEEWLRKKSLPNEGRASRTYVVCSGERIAAFYSLAVGSVSREAATGALRRNMHEPIPVMVLARLAVAVEFQGRQLGRAMIKDAVLRTMQVAAIAGIRAIMVNAINSDAVAFYRKCGFLPSPINSLTLFYPLKYPLD